MTYFNIAQWLRGALFVVPAAESRSGADDGRHRSRQVIKDARNLGAEVEIIRGDVSLLADMRKVFIGPKRPIRGVNQGAMVLRDKMLEVMTLQEYHEALACKHTGTWNLHRAATEQQGINLDFFIMLSSISGVVGTGSQSNYAAGNTFQGAFALYRHSLGLAAHSTNLGIIEDVGYLSQNEVLSDRMQSRSGLLRTGELQLHGILELSILQQTIGLELKGRDKEAGQMITGLPFPLPEDSPLSEDVRFRSLLAPHISEDNDDEA
ncbi:KR domain-containing protein [Jackrogersella minutella]|nr:KR domain-containing protein [Jackrogersella minutella]